MNNSKWQLTHDQITIEVMLTSCTWNALSSFSTRFYYMQPPLNAAHMFAKVTHWVVDWAIGRTNRIEVRACQHFCLLTKLDLSIEGWMGSWIRTYTGPDCHVAGTPRRVCICFCADRTANRLTCAWKQQRNPRWWSASREHIGHTLNLSPLPCNDICLENVAIINWLFENGTHLLAGHFVAIFTERTDLVAFAS